MIKEEQYASNINAGTFRTKEEAQAYLAYIRQKYGFSEENSFINGTSVIVTIEKSVTDDSYYYDMVDAIKGEKANRVNQYKMVSESRKNDKGETVPEKCDKCGGKVCVQIHGEPVFVCEKCGKYFGTMPCNIKEGKMKTISIKESELRKIVQETLEGLTMTNDNKEQEINESLKNLMDNLASVSAVMNDWLFESAEYENTQRDMEVAEELDMYSVYESINGLIERISQRIGVKPSINESIAELIYNKSDSYESVEDELYEMFSGEIDYLYNEGVIAYDDKHIKGMANGSVPIDYDDLIKSTLYDYGQTMSQDARQILNIYLKQGDTDEDVRGSIDRAIKEYSKFCW